MKIILLFLLQLLILVFNLLFSYVCFAAIIGKRNLFAMQNNDGLILAVILVAIVGCSLINMFYKTIFK